MVMKHRQPQFQLQEVEVKSKSYVYTKVLLLLYNKYCSYKNVTAAFNGAGKTRGASRGSGARHAPY